MATSTRQNGHRAVPREQQQGVTLSQLHKEGGNRGERAALQLKEGVRSLKESLQPPEGPGLGQHP